MLVIFLSYTKKKYNYDKKYVNLYYNFAEYIKILSTYAFFVNLYKSKINYHVYGIAIVLLIICNINFTIETILEDKEQNLFLKKWTHILSWIPKETLQTF